MFKIQFRNPAGRLVTAQLHDPAEMRKLADEARRDVPDARVCQLRIREVAVDEASGDFVWADVTDDFTR
ncbi:hypothetical protein [Streptomyces sp. TRM49041]|uniref:hypothetical protein n=1 Tax=Streptomyces sp. TRM49041 TaxID=2603216 RepID=UPI0011EE8E84|nr:hypothetical protein [Streptomyces sp. TRM49041]